MQNKQFDVSRTLQTLEKAMSRWHDAAMRLQWLSRLQMEALLVGDAHAFGEILWQKQTAQHEFRRAASRLESLKQNTKSKDWDSLPVTETVQSLMKLKRLEIETIRLLQEASQYECRSEEILRLKMRSVTAA
jgi:hypothetical protein